VPDVLNLLLPIILILPIFVNQMHYKKEEKLRILLKKNGQKELAPKQITTTLLYLGSPLMDFLLNREIFLSIPSRT